MVNYIFGGDYNDITLVEAQDKLAAITAVTRGIDGKAWIIAVPSALSDADYVTLSDFMDTKEKDQKADYAAATTADKADLVAKKVGLM